VQRILLLILLLTSSISLTGYCKARTQTSDEQLSVSESLEIRQFVRTFGSKLRNTRDLTPFLTEPPASTLLDTLLLDRNDSLPLVSDVLISRSNLKELREFWIATVNLAYLSELYVYTRTSVKGIRTYELPHEQQYPPAVVRLMKRNPILSKWWQQYDSDSPEQTARTIEQLRDLTATFQKAGTLMRARFKAHPPELTVQYRKNIAYLSKYLRVVNVDGCNSVDDCAGLPLHTKTITVNIPVLTLMLARIDGQLKILVISIIGD
jgi:hypothetical protein